MTHFFSALVIVASMAVAPLPITAPPADRPTHTIYIGEAVRHCVLPFGKHCGNKDHHGIRVRNARTRNGTVYFRDMHSRKRRELTLNTVDFFVVQI